MELTPGNRLGHYEILGLLGEGGMGQVYWARDTRLDRPVAIKVLHGGAAADPDYLARFDREARLLAALNHPNIAILHGREETDDGLRYLVMELVPGQTLASRLREGPLPLHEALAVGKQIAEALEAAHDRGIIHRDLKPGNVMLTPEGKVKVLDLGLARSTDTVTPPPPGSSTAPYEVQTREGAVVGTPGYIAPEQARGGPVDRRCDVWAFGCILYEVLTGRRAFSAANFSDTLAAVATRSSIVGSLPESVPPRVTDLLRRCLQEDVKKRLRDAGDARLELEESLTELLRGVSTVITAPAPSRSRWHLWPVFAIPVVAILAFGLARWMQAPAVRNWSGQLLLGGATRAYQPRLSPDGQWLAFIVVHEQQAQVGVMKLDSGEWWVLTRNRDRGQVMCVCWSLDSTRLYFDRFFDAPAGVYSVSPLDRNPEGAHEILVVKDADCPQVAPDGSLVVGKLDTEGSYRLNRLLENEVLRPVGPAIEFNRGWTSPVRALHTRNAVVFCGKVLYGKAPSQRRFYLLDLDKDVYRPVWDQNVQLEFLPLAVSPRDDFAWTALQAEDAFHILRIPLTGSGPPEPMLTLTTRVWGLEVDRAGRIYLDQVRRPLEVLRFAAYTGVGAAAPGPHPVERIAAPSLWLETGAMGKPLQMPDGRVILPSKVVGRDRLLVTSPGKDPAPMLEDNHEETAPPVTLVGPRRLAFLVGSDQKCRLRLAALEDGSVRLEPVELGVKGEGVTALAASPDGKTMYYVQSRQVYEVPADGSQPPRRLEAGDGVAVYPTTGELLLQRFERAGVRIFRLARRAGSPEEVKVRQGAVRLAPKPIGSGAIHRDGRVLVTIASKDSLFWRSATLSPGGELRPLPAAFEGDIFPAGWAKEDHVLGMGYPLRSELWRLLPVVARQQ